MLHATKNSIGGTVLHCDCGYRDYLPADTRIGDSRTVGASQGRVAVIPAVARHAKTHTLHPDALSRA